MDFAKRMVLEQTVLEGRKMAVRQADWKKREAILSLIAPYREELKQEYMDRLHYPQGIPLDSALLAEVEPMYSCDKCQSEQHGKPYQWKPLVLCHDCFDTMCEEVDSHHGAYCACGECPALGRERNNWEEQQLD